VELFRARHFDAVLLDLKMPGMDGIETLKELRKHDPNIPVIMITAFGDIATAVEAIKLGAYDFVEKPPQISRIVVTLKRAIEKAELEREIRALGKNIEESAAIKQAYDKLRELDQVKTTFLSSVSHELRTPLTSIVGYADVSRKKLAKLQSDISGTDLKISKHVKQVEENLVTIAHESERLSGLIESILDLTAMEAGTAEWMWQPLSLQEIIEDSADKFLPAFQKKGLELVVSVEESLPLIRGDNYRFFKVLHQILTNSLVFTEQGGVKLSARHIDKTIVLSITDTGKGIPASQCGEIFEKFSQVGDALTDKPKGVGLGLTICKLIVEYHGGKIGVESEPGKGSVFTIVLPVEEGVPT
jgi:signal transduction histidine kinase